MEKIVTIKTLQIEKMYRDFFAEKKIIRNYPNMFSSDVTIEWKK
jgi:hypothetical protein